MTTGQIAEPDWITGLSGRRYPARRSDPAQRDALILSLRARGLSFRAIAAQAGCSHETARRIIRTAQEADGGAA